MANHRLHDLQRRLKVKPTPPAAPAPVACDLAAQLAALIDEAVAKALGNTPSRPASASRLHVLEAKLSQLDRAMPEVVNPPSRPLREVFEGIPAATRVSPLPASALIEAKPLPAAGKMPRTRVTTTGRDANGHLATLTISTEGQPDTTVVVNARDPNGHILGIAVNGRQGQRQFHIQRDMNGLIAGLVEG